MKIRALFAGSVAAVALLAGMGTASAAPAVTIDEVFAASSESGTPPASPFTLLPLGTNGTANILVRSSGFTSDGDTIGFSGGSPTSGEYAGNISGDSASPFGANNGHQDYLTAGGTNGSVTLIFTTPQTSLALLWGTVDSGTGRNLITLSDGFTVNGSTIMADALSQGFGNIGDGTDDAYLTITGLSPFTSATFSDNAAAAFEFVPGVSVGTEGDPTPIPEPSTPWLFGAGLFGLLALRRYRSMVLARAARR